MKRYIRENLKSILTTAFLLVATITLITTNELIAKALPEASEMDFISCSFVGGKEFEYTGEEIRPEISNVLYRNEEGKTTAIYSEDIIVTYTNNTDVGYADVEVQMSGFKGSLVIEDVYQIIPATVSSVEVEQAEADSLHVIWTETVGADGYVLYRKSGEDVDFEEYYEIGSGSITEFVDTGIECNTAYEYYLVVFMESQGQKVYGNASENVVYVTQLERPSMVEVVSNSYDSLEVFWEEVDGAEGYELYRSESKDGEYACVAKIADSEITSYIDNNRECGKEYFYHIRAKQVVRGDERIGLASDIVSGRTKPNSSKITGSVNSECTEVSLSWSQAAGATGYELYKSVGDSSNYQLVKTFGENDARTWSETGLSEDSAVYYRVRSFCEYNGEIIYGSYSGSFQKQIKINMNYGSGSGSVSGVTQYVGTPYVWGGSSPSGWDCSGFTRWAIANFCGKYIPYGASSQGVNGTSVSVSDRSQWQPGDILAYSDGSGISHVALYIGDGQIMHALNSKYGTIVQSVDYYESWDSSNYLVSVRRY